MNEPINEVLINGKSIEQIMKELAEPFTPDEIEWRVGSTNKDKTKGIALAYVTNRAIMNRLDAVVGPFNWQNEFVEWKETSQLCGIGIRYNDEWVWKWDGADDSNTEAVKGGLSDSMKRAAYQWGIGRYLYNLENVWCELDQYKKLKTTPKLPDWALPAGYKDKTPSKTPSTRREPQKATSATSKAMDGQEVIRVLKNSGMNEEKARKWVEAQIAKGRSEADMMKLIEQSKAEKGNK